MAKAQTAARTATAERPPKEKGDRDNRAVEVRTSGL